MSGRWHVAANPDPTSPQQWLIRGPGRVYLRRTCSEAYALRDTLNAAEAAIVRIAHLYAKGGR